MAGCTPFDQRSDGRRERGRHIREERGRHIWEERGRLPYQGGYLPGRLPYQGSYPTREATLPTHHGTYLHPGYTMVPPTRSVPYMPAVLAGVWQREAVGLKKINNYG